MPTLLSPSCPSSPSITAHKTWRLYNSAPKLRLDHLKDVALMCKNTLHSERSLVSTFHGTPMPLKLEESATAEGVAAMYKVVEADDRAVRDLRLQVGDLDEDRYWPAHRTDPAAVETLEVEWGTVFTVLPGLRRSDLIMIPLPSKCIVKVLVAVAKLWKFSFYLERSLEL